MVQIDDTLVSLDVFEKQFLDLMEVKHKNVMEQLKAGKIDDDIKAVLKEEALNLSEHFV